MDPSEKEEVEAILAVVAADKEAQPLEPESPFPYQAANDNSERAWTGWLWLALALLVLSLAVGLIRIAFG